MRQIQNKFEVVSNERLCGRFYRMCIDAKPIVRSIKPGQFIHIRVNDSLNPFFRRPFSVYRAKKYVEIFYEPIGRGTSVLATKRKGDMLDILGPLGQGFSLPPRGTKQVVMVAGGIGIAPFLMFTDHLKNKKFELVLLYGARGKSHVYPMKEFKQNGCKIYVATEDGSVGTKGFVSALFDKINLDRESTFLYTCGPHAMMNAVQTFARQNNLRGEAACEETMACALGACLGCSIKTTSGYKTVCYDGPAFDLEEVIF